MFNAEQWTVQNKRITNGIWPHHMRAEHVFNPKYSYYYFSKNVHANKMWYVIEWTTESKIMLNCKKVSYLWTWNETAEV